MASALSDLRRIPHLQEATSVSVSDLMGAAPHYQRFLKSRNCTKLVSAWSSYLAIETIYTRPNSAPEALQFFRPNASGLELHTILSLCIFKVCQSSPDGLLQ